MQKFEHLVVCGDSYQTPSPNAKFYGTHWSEILAARRGLKLVTLASPGMSDTGIGFQILEAAKYSDALIAINMCPGLRLDRSMPNLATHTVTHYTDFRSHPSNTHPNNCIQINSLISLSLENDADRTLLTEINHSLEEFKQFCVIYYALTVLQKQTDNFLFFDSSQFKCNGNNISDLLDEKNIITRQQLDLTAGSINHLKTPNWEEIDPGYHTLPERQIQIADYIENRIWDGVR